MPETLDTLAAKITALGESFGARFDQVDRRFEQVDARFEQVDRRFEQVDRRFEQVDARFEQVDKKLEGLDQRLTNLRESTDKRFDEVSEAIAEQRRFTEFAFGQLRAEVKADYGRIDRKLDRVLDTLTGTSAPPRRKRSR